MGRSPCCDHKVVGLKKGPWTSEEDQKLWAYIQQHGHGSWRALPPKAGLQRCGKSCRLRWTNYLRPDIKRGEFSLQEQQSIIQLHALLGNRWSTIASHLPKRTDNEIKNYWNTHLKKKLTKMGIDPATHKPKSHANLSHMAQWETARLEAEARIVRESKSISSTSINYHSQLINGAIAAPLPPPMRPPCLDILKVWQGMWIEKGKNDISTFEGFFGGSNKVQQLVSPTSILTNISNINNVGLINDSTFFTDVNYNEALGACTIGGEQVKGIIGNSSIPNSSLANCFSDPLRFPSFLEGDTDVITANEEADNFVLFEDNYKINFWD
ncbi:hypothetical protein CASFOL_024169 [Castilleja foliolosa]|uniref:Uncharacterized protein n=1 Tax=Castilleja foliolosa TaxID=1961234 RepID=A0ABD3CMI2_9LAMI